MIQMTVTGNLGNDAVIRQSGNQFVVGFTLAHTKKYNDAKGVPHEKTQWIESALWYKEKEKAENMAKYMKKGQRILLQGEPEAEAWVSTDGQNLNARLKVVNARVEFQGAAPKPQQAQAGQASSQLPAPGTSASSVNKKMAQDTQAEREAEYNDVPPAEFGDVPPGVDPETGLLTETANQDGPF